MAALMALLLAPLSGGPARLRLVDEEHFPLARCLDGSRPPFYHRPATSATAKDKWFIHHMGGDFCGYGSTWGQWVDNCRLRANSTLGSSVWYEKNQRTWQLERSGVDFFDADPSRNPLMHDWNWVYLVYCDGHYYAGANTTRTFAPVHRGRAERHRRHAVCCEDQMRALPHDHALAAAIRVPAPFKRHHDRVQQ